MNYQNFCIMRPIVTKFIDLTSLSTYSNTILFTIQRKLFESFSSLSIANFDVTHLLQQ